MSARALVVGMALLVGCGKGGGDLGGLFEAQQRALEASDEAAFRAGWHPEGYQQNLIGGSGLAGERVFKQGSRKGWHLRPKLDAVAPQGPDVHIVPCDVYSPKEDRVVDSVDVVVARHEGRLVIVGAGERLDEVKALADRVVARQPLAPAKK